MTQQPHTDLDTIMDEAMNAFWQVIVKHFPTATSGDLSPWAEIRFSQIAEDAVTEWIKYNVLTQSAKVAVGYRFALFQEVDRFPDFRAPAGLRGTVTSVETDGTVWAKIDQPIAGAEQWDNQIHWADAYHFAKDTMPA